MFPAQFDNKGTFSFSYTKMYTKIDYITYTYKGKDKVAKMIKS